MHAQFQLTKFFFFDILIESPPVPSIPLPPNPPVSCTKQSHHLSPPTFQGFSFPVSNAETSALFSLPFSFHLPLWANHQILSLHLRDPLRPCFPPHSLRWHQSLGLWKHALFSSPFGLYLSSSKTCYIFFYSHMSICLLIRERKGAGEREGEKHWCEKHQLVASHICPDQESNPQPSLVQDNV